MALTFSSSTPSTGAVDYYINSSMELVFNEALDEDTITSNVIFLYDLSASVNVPITVAIKATDSTKIVVTPSVALKENSNYRLVIVGTDQGLDYYLSASNGDNLVTTVTVLFSTGDNVYKIDTTVEKEAANVTLEGDLFLPVNIKALGYDFTVSKVRPVNHSYGLTGNQTGVVFTFTKSLLTGQDLSTWTEVNVYPILQDTTYLCSGTTLDLGSGSITIPGYSVSVNGQDLQIYFDYPLPKNVAVTVDLNTNIKSSDNDQYGGSMKYSCTTQLYPTVFGPYAVKNELPALKDQIYDDYISALLFKNSMWLWERLGRTFSLDDLSFAAKKYILMSTVLDIIEDTDYKKFVVAGTRRQLGDLNVSVDNLIGRLALKAIRVQKERDLSFESLKQGWQCRTVAYSTAGSTFVGSRLWYDINQRYTDPIYKYYQPNLPVSNTSLNRQAKTINPTW